MTYFHDLQGLGVPSLRRRDCRRAVRVQDSLEMSHLTRRIMRLRTSVTG